MSFVYISVLSISVNPLHNTKKSAATLTLSTSNVIMAITKSFLFCIVYDHYCLEFWFIFLLVVQKHNFLVITIEESHFPLNPGQKKSQNKKSQAESDNILDKNS